MKAHKTQYGGKDVEGMESAIDARLNEWIHLIDQNWASLPGETKSFDIGRSIQFLTTDIISHLCFGKPLGFVKNQKDMVRLLQPIFPLFKQIRSPKTLSQDSRAPPESTIADLEKYNSMIF